MNWKNLNNYKCPKCASQLVKDIDHLHHCANPDCEFAIGDSKLADIISKKPKTYHTPTEEENASALNNL